MPNTRLSDNCVLFVQQDAVAQRERLKQERIAAREQRSEPVSEENEQDNTEQGQESQSDESEFDGDLNETGNTGITMRM